MKNNYYNFRNLGLIIILVILVSLSAFYYLGGFGGGNEYQFQNYVVFFENDVKSVDGNWKNIEKEPFSSKVDLGFVDEEFYVSLDLHEYEGKEDPLYLELNNPTFREVALYRVSDEGGLVLLEMLGTGVKSNNPLRNPNPVFKLKFSEENLTSILVFKIKTNTPVDFMISASSEADFFNNYSKRILFVSVYLGVMIALFLYNLILYFSVKDKVYLYYCFYIFFIGLAQLSLSGHSYYFFLGQNAYLYEISIVGFTVLSSIFVIPFIRLFLKTKLYLPRTDNYLNAIVYVYLFALMVSILGFVELSYMIMDLNGIIIAATFFYVGIYVAKKGYRSAYFFLLAWSILLVGLVLFILQNQGVINIEPYANLPMLAGTAIEAILLSFALADKINILKEEKEKEQHDKLEALKENERLIKDQNVYLEKMVQSRTEELELTLKNLQNTQTQLVNQEKMASLGQLTAGIAHEINNPINFVSSNISPLKRDMKDILEIMDVYREKGKDEFSTSSKQEIEELEEDLELDYLIDEIEQLLQGMEDGARRTVEIVKGLRLFSRVDEQDVKRVDIHDGLDSTLILLNSSMGGNVKITKDYGEVPMVECLAGKINQVFMNIINNAIHALQDVAHPVKNPEIIIRTLEEDGYVRIEIQDNGPGMPEHVKEKIFEPFFTTKPVGKGTGLGLSIVYTIIENHNGILEVNSKENEGTIFVIKLPVDQN